MHGVIPFLQHLSQATILAHNVLVCAYTVTSHDTFTRCASVLGHVTDSRYLYLSVLILVTSLVSSVLVLVTGHDTCILSHLLSYHSTTTLDLPPKSDSQNGQSLDFTLRLSSESSEIFKSCNRQSHSVVPPRDTHSSGSIAWQQVLE